MPPDTVISGDTQFDVDPIASTTTFNVPPGPIADCGSVNWPELNGLTLPRRILADGSDGIANTFTWKSELF